jgi:hypothetical protein
MIVSQSARSELLDVFPAGAGTDVVRYSLRVVLEEPIELPATELNLESTQFPPALVLSVCRPGEAGQGPVTDQAGYHQ